MLTALLCVPGLAVSCAAIVIAGRWVGRRLPRGRR